ncbi:MAG TPA: hypothetical protein VG273_22675 [Bryobacteraceae bacterium]|jgi:hypothetical protein|nr:hypothetical protein [Bryobacteraceae bacterium]
MDYTRAQALKLGTILAFMPLASSARAQMPDPADLLVQARDRVLAAANRPLKISCIQTMERSYFSRVRPPGRAPSCDEIAAERKNGRAKLKLDATDRFRVKVFPSGAREVFAWIDPLQFESHDLEEVLLSGPLGTGAFGGYLVSLFASPTAAFQYLGEKAQKTEYGFRDSGAVGAHLVKAGTQWLPAAINGSFVIDQASLDTEQLIIGTSSLPPGTNMCESASTVDYARVLVGSEEVLLPKHAESHAVMSDAKETNNIVTYVSCVAEVPRSAAPVKAASILPANYGIVLRFDAAIDSDTAAAGDVVSATVGQDVVAREGASFKVLLAKGTKVRGRILNVTSYSRLPNENARPNVIPESYLVIAISFDVAEINGIASPLHVRLDSGMTRALGRAVLTPDSSRWPEDSLVFNAREKHFVVPAGFQSSWITTK